MTNVIPFARPRAPEPSEPPRIDTSDHTAQSLTAALTAVDLLAVALGAARQFDAPPDVTRVVGLAYEAVEQWQREAAQQFLDARAGANTIEGRLP